MKTRGTPRDVARFPTPIKSREGRIFEGEREVCCVRKGQEWRIPAWRLIRAAFERSGWNDDFERLQGMLFGYEEWQTVWWIAHIREHRASAASGREDEGQIHKLENQASMAEFKTPT